MLKVPLQIYLDPDVVQTLKHAALSSGTSVSLLIRTAIDQSLDGLKKSLAKKRKDDREKLVKFFKEVELIAQKNKDIPYHHSDKTDDQLLYGE